MITPDIFTYIKSKENEFDTQEVKIGENWSWSFKKHVQMIFHLKNGVFFTGENNFSRAFKAVMLPMLNLAYWMEDLEVKDVVFFIESTTGRVLSFLVKKYHDEVYVREHDLDVLFDEITESDLDYGGVLVQKRYGQTPEVIALTTIAFCDQTDLMGGAIGFKHQFSTEKLRSMAERGWGDKSKGATVSVEELITLATEEKNASNKSDTDTIEVYIVRNNFPEHYLKDNNNMTDYYGQVHVVAYYTKKGKTKQGVTLYRMREDESDLMFHTSKKVEGRALGMGEGEMLVHPQVWTNFLTIHKMNLLESASKVPLYTDDSSYKNRNKIQDMENLEITIIEDGKRINQVPTAAPANIQLISGSINEWFEHAQLTSSAFDPVIGKEASAGTTFRGQERTVAQGRGLHDRRRGQRAKFIERIYRECIIPDIVKQLLKGPSFLATLSTDELSWVVDQLSINYVNQQTKDAVLSGKEITKEQQEELKKIFKETFSKKGNKHILQVLKDDFKDIEIRMGINVANKQKDLVNLSDKLLSIFQYIFSNPVGFQQAMRIPALAKSFQDILEFSGINQSDFQSLLEAPDVVASPQQPQPQQEMQLNQPVVPA